MRDANRQDKGTDMKRFFWTMIAIMVVATSAVAQSAYRIKPGDVLAVEVLEDANLNRQVLVLPDGRISFPLAGSVDVSGRSVGDVSGALAAALAPNFASTPSVFVTVTSLSTSRGGGGGKTGPRTIDVFGIGELKNPGLAQVKRGTTLLQYLAAAGGFTPFAATKRIQLRRNDPSSGRDHVYRFNYHAVTRGAAIQGDFRLMEGDVVIVPERRLFE